MHASTLLAAAALWASASASAIPTGVHEELVAGPVIQKRAEPTAAWVTIDDEGQPVTTYTPSMTVEDGTTKYINGAPHDLTASLYTHTNLGEITTRTGAPPNPTPTGKHGEGAFSRCVNKDGDRAPFCEPAADSILIVGQTYYVTWDPDYFNTTHDNTTFEVSARLDWYNRTSGSYEHLGDDSDRTPAAWGFWPFTIQNNMLLGSGEEHNITVTLLSNIKGSSEKHNSTTLPLQLLRTYYEPSKPTPAPKGRTLTIALPTVFGVIILLLRHGSRGRLHNYSGRAQRRVFGARKDNGIQLDTHVVSGSPGDEYRDAPVRPHRDSDDLGSMAGSPLDPDFQKQGTTGGRNAFREELRRQEQERI
ncbi:hypothetical protein G7046_g2315 [Stylonectria norvegica]|nr:hypothetical protein G7046_g2315 [Stylonectria norvegica]